MALSQDQKAMLKLVAQPETSYEDIAALMGLSVEEVRAKVDAALAELDQASESAPASEEKAPEPAPPPPKEEPVAENPPPQPPSAEKPKPARKPRAAPRKPKLKLPDDKGARYGLFAGIAVVVVLVLLLVTGVLGGDDDSGEPASVAESGAVEGGSGQKTPTQALLKEVDGSGASGRALFARAKNQVVLAVRVKDVDPAPAGNFYAISLSKASGDQVPLVATVTNKKDEIVNAFKIKPQYLGFLASGFDQMEVALVPTKDFEAALAAAKKGKTSLKYGGTVVASGPVTGPAVEAAEAEAAEAAEAAEEGG